MRRNSSEHPNSREAKTLEAPVARVEKNSLTLESESRTRSFDSRLWQLESRKRRLLSRWISLSKSDSGAGACSIGAVETRKGERGFGAMRRFWKWKGKKGREGGRRRIALVRHLAALVREWEEEEGREGETGRCRILAVCAMAHVREGREGREEMATTSKMWGGRF